jgi:uncharacterized membrane protein
VINWLHLISTILLIGTLFALRWIVLPSLEVLTPEQSTLLMGKLMPKARRVIRLSLLVIIASGVYQTLKQGRNDLLTAAGLFKLALALATAAVVLVLSVSPIRRLSMRLEPHRKRLLDLALFLGIASTLVALLT